MITTFFLTGSYWVTMWSYYYSSTTDFCISCHEMVEPYQQYKDSLHYKNGSGVVADCADCHLPPGAFEGWYAKIAQGAKDSVMHVLLDPDDIDYKKWRLAAMRNIRSEACQSCHKDLISPGLTKGGLIAHKAFLRGEAKTCLQCHENLVHGSHE